MIWEEITTVHKQKGYLHVKSFHFKSEYVKAMKERIVFREFFFFAATVIKTGNGATGTENKLVERRNEKWGKTYLKP